MARFDELRALNGVLLSQIDRNEEGATIGVRSVERNFSM